MFCAVILFMNGETYCLKSIPQEKTFRGNFILISDLFLPADCAEKKSLKEIFFHIFVLMSDLGFEPQLYV